MPSLAVHRSRSQIPDFKLLRPLDLAEACAMLREYPGIVPLGGGVDLVNRMKEAPAPARLMMLSGVPELASIQYDAVGHLLRIGATTRHDDVATSDVVRAQLPDLAACWDRIANIRIRMQGTVAGNILAGMSGYEGPVLLSALDASASVWRHERAETLPIAALAGRNGTTGFDGLVIAIGVPLPSPGVTRRLVYDRSLRPALSVALQIDHAAGVVSRARAVLGGCHDWPIVRDLAIKGGMTLSTMAGMAEDVTAQAFGDMSPPTVPWFGAPQYRERVAQVLLPRLLREVAR